VAGELKGDQSPAWGVPAGDPGWMCVSAACLNDAPLPPPPAPRLPTMRTVLAHTRPGARAIALAATYAPVAGTEAKALAGVDTEPKGAEAAVEIA